MSSPPTDSYPRTPSLSSLATSVTSLSDSSHSKSSLTNNSYRFGTLCVTTEHKDQFGASSVPIYQTATFKGLPGGQYDYTRSGNPTRTALETQLARLYECRRAFAVSTGMTALDMIIRLVSPGDVIIAGDDIYGGTDRLLTFTKTNGGADVRHIDMTSQTQLDAVLEECGTKVKMVLIESPTNPMLKVLDIKRIADSVHTASPDSLIVVDNTMMSPYLQRPLNLGADIIYDSGTKYLSGHHDVMAGIIAVEREEVVKRIAFLINSTGTGLAPFDCHVLLRGLKTLSIRMDRQASTASMVASYLDTLGFQVNFPGLLSHPGRDIHFRQADGAGAVLSFSTGDVAMSERIVGGTRLWGVSVSFGCVNSLISMPCVMSHASIAADKRAERGLPEDLIRLCVGIEDPRDLIDDLERSLLEAGAIYERFDESASIPTTPTSSSVPESAHASAIINHAFMADPSSAESWAVQRAKRFRRGGVQLGSAADADETETLGLELGQKLDIQQAAAQGQEDIVVSAPGKVIMFGEHAVVHGVTAIAASINLRCFAILSKRPDQCLRLDLPDMALYEKEWPLGSLPWDDFTASPLSDGRAPAELDQRSLKALEAFLHDDGLPANAHVAALAILYLYMTMCNHGVRRGASYCARSALPIGAGLGSSASYAACISAAFLQLFGLLSVSNSTSIGRPDTTYPGRQAINNEQATLINEWAFLAEKVIHGNPSGIDNAVAVRGGGLTFERAINGKSGGMKNLQGFKSVRLLLTDTRVPRQTKLLVAGVGERMTADPAWGTRMMDGIQSISDEAQALLTDVTKSRGDFVTGLSSLLDRNHEYLAELGVSHPALELIRTKTGSAPYRLSTKLTGAGGGGCAVTLIPDDFSTDRLDALLTELRETGFRPYLTSVGGSGLGILDAAGTAAVDLDAPGAGGSSHIPLRKAFHEVTAEQLETWAEQTGDWLFI
ncbi:hypothetical protein QFC22_005207 [Naganishia vaughanmartiniae]|uniref:Uncharacterized protein n=1 Tax=Naganishia vaughanmartiniae TaxID=1424756 RepID=A0ACC2WUJ2_9TREE|nr:hypothetical protein QFC22_005207 [Naganishia vaughanmartiniae]